MESFDTPENLQLPGTCVRCGSFSYPDAWIGNEETGKATLCESCWSEALAFVLEEIRAGRMELKGSETDGERTIATIQT